MPAAVDAHPAPANPGATLVTDTGETLPLTRAELSVEAKGGIARAVLTQTFENDHDDPLHVTYKMPLPADGAVSGYAFEIGDRTITGDVRSKEKARADFEAALAQGKTAGILEQEKADIFTQEIGNVPPRTTVTAKITVDMRLAWLPEGEWEMRFPTVVGPRYVSPSDTAETARAVHIGVAKGGIAARMHLRVNVRDELVAGARVTSPTHAVETTNDGVVELSAADGARLDRDIVVRWRVARPEVGLSLSTGKRAGRAYGLLTLVPPSIDAHKKPVARDLIVLLDTSGSMGGLPLTHAKALLRGMIGSLGADDRLELIEFSDSPRAYKNAPVLATESEKRDALTWLDAREAGGATEMRSAVLAALTPLREDAQRQVVLVTDGYIGGENEILTVLADSLPKGCRMHMVGVGAAPNRALATAIARAGRGAEILTTEGEDLERAQKRLVDKTRAPMLTDVTVSGAAVTLRAPESIPDVYAGAPLLVAVELAEGGGEITVHGTTPEGPWQRTVRAPRVDVAQDNGAIPALFARERVADLDVRWAMGRNAAEIDRQVERIGLDFQIATRLTSFVAIDDRKSVDPSSPYRKVSVPQELPHGTSFQSFGLGGAPGGGMPVAAPAMMQPMSYGMTAAGSIGAPPSRAKGKARPAPEAARSVPPSPAPPPRAMVPPPAQPAGPSPAKPAPEPEALPAELVAAPTKRARPWLLIAIIIALAFVALIVILFFFLFH